MFSKRVTMILASLCCLSTGQARTIAQPVITRPAVNLEIPRTTVVHKPTNPTTQLPTITPSTGTAPMPGAGSISDRLRLGRGGMDGGGGNAVVCRDNDGRVTRAKLLDLFEGEALDGLIPQKFDENLSFEEIAKLVAKIIDEGGGGDSISGVTTTTSGGVITKKTTLITPPRSSDSITRWVDFIIKRYRVLPEEIGLDPIPDSGHFIFPRNCMIEQLAVYKDDTSQIFFVNDIWKALDKTHKAALLVHEALYKNLRSLQESNSDRTRKVVALAFSGFKFKPLLQGIAEGDMIICNSFDGNTFPSFMLNAESYDHRFVLRPHPESKDHAILQFVMFDGLVPLSKLTQVLPINMTHLSPFAEENSTNVIAFDMKENFLNPSQTFIWKKTNTDGKLRFFMAAPATNSVGESDYIEITCHDGGFKTQPDGSIRSW